MTDLSQQDPGIDLEQLTFERGQYRARHGEKPGEEYEALDAFSGDEPVVADH